MCCSDFYFSFLDTQTPSRVNTCPAPHGVPTSEFQSGGPCASRFGDHGKFQLRYPILEGLFSATSQLPPGHPTCWAHPPATCAQQLGTLIRGWMVTPEGRGGRKPHPAGYQGPSHRIASENGYRRGLVAACWLRARLILAPGVLALAGLAPLETPQLPGCV